MRRRDLLCASVLAALGVRGAGQSKEADDERPRTDICQRLILYGCGDFLSEDEGIGGYESYRAKLGLMYFPTVDARDGALQRLTLTPTEVRYFRVNRARPDEARWMAATLDRESRVFGTRVEWASNGLLRLAP
jgi:poly-gamma-glutamate synthesis protein (capsule biosynthesis protein)